MCGCLKQTQSEEVRTKCCSHPHVLSDVLRFMLMSHRESTVLVN